jgi:hypothetical protein
MPSLASLSDEAYTPPDASANTPGTIIDPEDGGFNSVANAVNTMEIMALNTKIHEKEAELTLALEEIHRLKQAELSLKSQMRATTALLANIDAKEILALKNDAPREVDYQFAPSLSLVLLGGEEYLMASSKRTGVRQAIWPTTKKETYAIMNGVRRGDLCARALAEHVTQHCGSMSVQAPDAAILLRKEFLKRIEYEEGKRQEVGTGRIPSFKTSMHFLVRLFDPFGPRVTRYELDQLITTMRDIRIPGIGPTDSDTYKEELNGRDLMLAAFPHYIGTHDEYFGLFEYVVYTFGVQDGVLSLFDKYGVKIKFAGVQSAYPRYALPIDDRDIAEHFAQHILRGWSDARRVEAYCIRFRQQVLSEQHRAHSQF